MFKNIKMTTKFVLVISTLMFGMAIISTSAYLGLSKSVDNEDVYLNLNKVLFLYVELLKEISLLDDEIIVQFDEALFVKDLDTKTLSLIKPVYDTLAKVSSNIKIVVSTYFEHSNEASKILLETHKI